jgi:methylmalonyl-CoA mutase
VVGVSAFANLDETLPVPSAVDQAAIAARVPAPLQPLAELWSEPLRVRRDAAPYEQLRAEAPEGKVFLANLGPLAEHNARATWVTNLLAAGGVRVESTDGHRDAAAAAEAFRASSCQVAIVCGSDRAYASTGSAVVEALIGAGARQVWLAGRPGGLAAELTKAGLHDAVYLGRDVLAVLRDIHSGLGA